MPQAADGGGQAAGSWRRLGGEDDLSGDLGERKHTAGGRGGGGGVLSHAERAERPWVPVTATILGFCLIPWAGRALRPTPKSQGVDCYSIS